MLSVDLGATKVVSALVLADGSIAHRSGRIVHANDGPDGVLRALSRSIRECRAKVSSLALSRVGVAVAAQVEPTTGTIVHSPNLHWRDVPLAARLRAELDDVPVTVVNDARAATLAEWRLGAGRGVSDLFCLVLGTGVGGSAVVGGRLLEGGTNALGEVGHITIVGGGRKCHCPNTGCLEAYVGGWAIAERAREEVVADPVRGAELIRRAGSAKEITARTVFDGFRADDPLSVEIVEETEDRLADGAVSIANAFNPRLVVLGGGLVTGLPELENVVASAIRTRCQPPAAMARVVIGRFAEDAPLVGAAEAARLDRRPVAR